MNSKKYSTEILKKQLQDLMKSTDLGFSVGLVDDNDFYKWTVCFTGPEDTIYEGGFFKAILTFPDDFPQNPPEMKFITEMWHPNIYKDGRVCISILHSPGVDRFNEQETAEESAQQLPRIHYSPWRCCRHLSYTAPSWCSLRERAERHPYLFRCTSDLGSLW